MVRKTVFVYDDTLSRHSLSDTHPMKPERLRYTYELLDSYHAFTPEHSLLVPGLPWRTNLSIHDQHPQGGTAYISTLPL